MPKTMFTPAQAVPVSEIRAYLLRKLGEWNALGDRRCRRSMEQPCRRGGEGVKGNPHKKLTHEDKFSRRYACWVKNNRKAWMWFKKQNRRKFRRLMKKEEPT